MNNRGSFWVWFLTVPLLAYSAFRNLDLILSTMGQDPGAVVAGVGALFALDLGVLFWLAAFNHARGNQRSIAGVMMVVCLLGAASGLLADTLLKANGGQHDLIALVAQWAIPVIIASNFAAGILYHANDPERRLQDRQREIDDLLKERLADALAANSGEIISAAVPVAVQHQQRDAVSRFLSGMTQVASTGVPSVASTPPLATLTANDILSALKSAGVDVASLAHTVPASAPEIAEVASTPRRNGKSPKGE